MGTISKHIGTHENQVRFSPDYNAIMWISTKGVSQKDEKIIVDIIHEKLKKKLIFIGHCFGRYDLIAEFKDSSARVASNIVCELQEELAKKLRTRLMRTRPKIVDPICSSLTLGNKMILPRMRKRTRMNYSLRTYTFLRPKKSTVNLKEIMLKIEPIMELFWTTSSYAFLLTAKGSNFSEIFRKILDFRSKTKRCFRESCTYVGLDFKMNDKKISRPIRALTFLKMSKGFGEFRLKKNEDDNWNTPEKRFGWSDICLAPKNKYSLRELKDAIMKLREDHKGDLITTSTLLLPNGGEK